jgi:dihydrofolate reductase
MSMCGIRNEFIQFVRVFWLVRIGNSPLTGCRGTCRRSTRSFLRFIEGQTVIIGRRSYEIFGEGLTSSHTVVVSRSAGELSGAVFAPSVEDALRIAGTFDKTIFSAGGASI